MTWYENIKGWTEMPLKQRLNFLIGGIIVILCFIIIHYEWKISENRKEYNQIISEIVTRRDAREAGLEAKVDICNQSYLQYLQKSEAEYRELLFQAKKLKEKIDGNEGS